MSVRALTLVLLLFAGFFCTPAGSDDLGFSPSLANQFAGMESGTLEKLGGELPGLPPSWKRRACHFLQALAAFIVLVTSLYALRHYGFTLNRLFSSQRHPYLDIESADWPPVAVYVPAHNEEAVVGDAIRALLSVDYPPERMRIVPIDDRSTDGTAGIIDAFVKEYPERIVPLHRTGGRPGKAAALKEATEKIAFGEIAIVFDADYIPSPGLLKMLVAPFLDPEVGAVMGRVVPLNVKRSLLTRMLELERAAGYQVDQQARMNLSLVPQYGGTVGGVRRRALQAVGGWDEQALAEDTDITYRLLLAGWKTVYENRAECYEEVPETWPVRIRQISRWARGHNQSMAKYSLRLVFNRNTGWLEKVDGLLLLGIYAYAPLLLLGWVVTFALFLLGNPPYLLFGILSIALFGTFGNFATFFQLAAAVRLDGYYRRIRLLPFTLIGFLVSILAVSRVTLSQVLPFFGSPRKFWAKTERFRRTA